MTPVASHYRLGPLAVLAGRLRLSRARQPKRYVKAGHDLVVQAMPGPHSLMIVIPSAGGGRPPSDPPSAVLPMPARVTNWSPRRRMRPSDAT